MKQLATGADRRAFGRRPTNQHAVAHIAGRAPLRCSVRDISEGGALLDFGEAVSLPWRLRLVWDGTGEAAECEVRHVRGGQAGVQFICANGPRIAKESIALSSAGHTSAPLTLAPAPVREAVHSDGGSLVQRFREARQPAKITIEVPAVEALPEPAAYVPLPLAASAYASMQAEDVTVTVPSFIYVPLPLAASAYAAFAAL
jgi:PilZ domain